MQSNLNRAIVILKDRFEPKSRYEDENINSVVIVDESGYNSLTLNYVGGRWRLVAEHYFNKTYERELHQPDGNIVLHIFTDTFEYEPTDIFMVYFCNQIYDF